MLSCVEPVFLLKGRVWQSLSVFFPVNIPTADSSGIYLDPILLLSDKQMEMLEYFK